MGNLHRHARATSRLTQRLHRRQSWHAGTPTRTLNVLPTGAQTALTSAKTFNTLNLTGTLGVTMSGAGSLTLAGGGLIGNTTGTISGGTLEGSSGSPGN